MSRREATKPWFKNQRIKTQSSFRNENHLMLFSFILNHLKFLNDEYLIATLDARNSNPPSDAEVCIERRNPSAWIFLTPPCDVLRKNCTVRMRGANDINGALLRFTHVFQS